MIQRELYGSILRGKVRGGIEGETNCHVTTLLPMPMPSSIGLEMEYETTEEGDRHSRIFTVRLR